MREYASWKSNPVRKTRDRFGWYGRKRWGYVGVRTPLTKLGGQRVGLYHPARRRFHAVPAHQLTILRKMNVSVNHAHEINDAGDADLIIDGLIGYSLKGAPTGSAADLIRWSNRQSIPVLALDVPSGVDTTHGTAFDPAIKATATLTLALPKQGLLAPGVENLVGELYLADISVPPNLYASPPLGLQVGPLFAVSEILRLW
ncbi:MAG: NAD(P)H-hydrate epimerase [Candidatus Moduliflexus flocculans]|nr:NAD(P)H-hydrate epimerase [Candidatus Moduliflexus flocculans]